jgi:hypothetical protein
MGGKESLDRETFKPALAMELRLESGFECFRKATDSGGVEIMELEDPGNGLEIDTGSLLDCINAAMDNRCFTPA